MFSKFFIVLIRIYQLCFSPFLANRCRFYPSCSQYALETFKYDGLFKAFFKVALRILKCQPFHKGGVDLPVKNIGNRYE